jgi:hypothetical protein
MTRRVVRVGERTDLECNQSAQRSVAAADATYSAATETDIHRGVAEWKKTAATIAADGASRCTPRDAS